MDTIKKLFLYDKWANQRLLGSLAELPEENRRSIDLVSHVLMAEKVWLMRMKGEDTSSINKLPQMSVADCEALASELAVGYEEFIESLSTVGRDDIITYRNFSGNEFSTSIKDILTHVAMHGSYHRGQAAASIRAAGSQPIDTDFIVFVRENNLV